MRCQPGGTAGAGDVGEGTVVHRQRAGRAAALGKRSGKVTLPPHDVALIQVHKASALLGELLAAAVATLVPAQAASFAGDGYTLYPSSAGMAFSYSVRSRG